MNANLKEYIRLCSIPAVQEKIREGMGEFQEGDLYAIEVLPGDWRVEIEGGSDNIWRYRSAALRKTQGYDPNHLPQVHDLRNPERGLWGMVGKECGSFKVWRLSDNETYRISFLRSEIKDQEAATPEIALLRALMHQWGIKEVKG